MYDLIIDGETILPIDEEKLSYAQKQKIIKEFCSKNAVSPDGAYIVKRHWKARLARLQ